VLDWAFAGALEAVRHPNEQLYRAVDRLREALASPPWPDVNYWGTTPQAQQAARAMADLAGGPAPMRT